MCEPFMVARTGLSVREHQARTVGSYLDLRALAPDLPFIPVLQGFTRSEYLECLARYDRAGIDLVAEPLVGLGSVCRRQSDQDIQALVTELAAAGLRLHGFGIKVRGFRRYGHLLESADSMAWSYAARRSSPLPGHRHLRCMSYLHLTVRCSFHQQGSWCGSVVVRLMEGQAALPTIDAMVPSGRRHPPFVVDRSGCELEPVTCYLLPRAAGDKSEAFHARQ